VASKLISTTAEVIMQRNLARKSWIIQNEDTAIDVFVLKERAETLTVSTTVHDHRIGPGGILTLNDGTDGKQAIQDRWTVVAASGTPRIAFFETEDIDR